MSGTGEHEVRLSGTVTAYLRDAPIPTSTPLAAASKKVRRGTRRKQGNGAVVTARLSTAEVEALASFLQAEADRLEQIGIEALGDSFIGRFENFNAAGPLVVALRKAVASLTSADFVSD